mmetsp:Transcript_31809/g.67378  ORF Transcript_31809/g.67378 Transcript_31809/m.67378 type:complete len:217 (+) Transcript_31809:984-1634(+)
MLRGKKSDIAAAPVCTKADTGTKFTQVDVTAVAVAAGATTAIKIRTFGASVEDNQVNSSTGVQEDDVPSVIPKDKPSPFPLSVEWIEHELKDAAKVKSSSPPDDNKKLPSELVKDFDSKIEALSIREEMAKAHAEEKRLEELEEAHEVRKQEQAEVDARVDAAEKIEQQQQQQWEKPKESNKAMVEHGSKGGTSVKGKWTLNERGNSQNPPTKNRD